MNDNVTVSVFELAQMFPDAESARLYLEERRWADGVACPHCDSGERIGVRKGGYYRCHACKKDFTVRTGTIFERSHIPLHKWIYGMYLLVTERKGISSLQLYKQISITQKSAWFMLQRLREACGNDLEKLRGIVAVDETFVGGKKKNMRLSKRKTYGRGTHNKAAVVGMREQGGRTKAVHVKSVNAKTVCETVREHVEPGAMLHTDEYAGYEGLEVDYGRETVCHSKNQYVNNGASTNNIESVWAVMKRGLNGVYHHASEKHLGRYADEFAFRLNEGNVRRHTIARIGSLADAAVGRRITYKELTK